MAESQRPAGAGPGERVLLFDGVCILCAGWVHFVIKRDPEARILLASVQSDEGQALLSHYGFNTVDFDTMVFVEDGVAYSKSTAFLRAARFLTWPWRWLTVGRWLMPRVLRDWCYDRVARNRYRLFGQKEACMLPTPEMRRHFLEFQVEGSGA